jgi:chromosome segregation ATPase
MENKGENEDIIKSKDEQIKSLKKKLEEQEIDLKQQLDEKDKSIQELINKNEKENNSYAKKIYDLTNQLNTANLELNEHRNKRKSVSLSEMLDNPNTALEDQLDECKKNIEKLNEEIKYYEKQIENLKKDSVKSKKYDELEAKFKYNEDTIETMKKNINELKEQKKKEKDDFDKELEKVNIELSTVKCELAKANFEKDLAASKSKRYINKLKSKMIAFGFKFKTKNI